MGYKNDKVGAHCEKQTMHGIQLLEKQDNLVRKNSPKWTSQ